MACVAFGCTSHSSRKTDADRRLTFHRFPEDEKLRETWIKALHRKNWMPSQHSRLCSKHFTPQCYKEGKTRNTLRRDAVPTIFENYPNYLQKESSKLARNQILDLHRTLRAKQRNVKPTYDSRDDKLSQPSTSTQLLEQAAVSSETRGKRPSQPSTSRGSCEQNPDHFSSLCEPRLDDTPRKKKLRKTILKLSKTSTRRLKKLRAVQQKCRRLKQKITSLENLIDEIKSNNYINDESAQILKDIGAENKDFLERYINKKKGNSLPREYCPELRKFAVTLNFLSPRAYTYIRRKFDCALPHPSTISKWYKSIECTPGFTTESLETIKQKTKDGKKIYCALIIDGMAIRKVIEWDGVRYFGYVDVGNGLTGEAIPVAKEALVFMLTSLNQNWKIPVGFFFIDGITGSQLATLVRQCISLLNECNVVLSFLTFDGLPANLAMATDLGCNLDLNQLKTTFVVHETEVGIYPDPCHNIKLVRNTFAETPIMYDENGDVISWEYVTALNNLQAKEGFHAANKLRQEHVLFAKQKIKVRLATQVLSASVADSLDMCREKSIPGFENSAATANFIRLFNNLFDILNSRSMKAKGWKRPIADFNCGDIWAFFETAEKYIRNLRFTDTSVITSRRKTGFLGFVICMRTVQHMYNLHVSPTSDFKYLCTYKISQDHVELFFSAIRSKGGFNNNPSARQFIAAYKRLLVHAQFKSDGKGKSILTKLTQCCLITDPFSKSAHFYLKITIDLFYKIIK